MKWYPWLTVPYRDILSRYQLARGHHALLLHSKPGTGELSLCYAISRWLICRQPNGIKSCGRCHSCRLMLAGNHPDFYQPELEKNQQSLGGDSIRTIIDGLYERAYQGGMKVVSLLYVEQLTELAVNVLLKTLEEPPENTYFLLVCQTPARLLATLRSRCFYWLLRTPHEELGLRWLREMGYDNPLSAVTALRLCDGAPLAAKILLNPIRWQVREELCVVLREVLTHGDLLALLPTLNRDKDIKPLHWLLSLLTDALKWQQNAQEFIINADKTPLVAELAARWPARVLMIHWQQLLHCLLQCQEISGVNRELFLTYHLLNCEYGVANAYAFL
ncbi:DNA polymerase III subunit delta' C-terminal domain-containing protein [Sodalis endosymbiont of Henestaris halophilus]|uniref:DNA polymerase III subunit delta' C-terminal domain-containing protein n=1 Tax=Sodalis endosymbiont of Henestaris halophilus TaxID=1929246 RepID=UPI000BBF9806|nr:DNA polymerase III subunit delta' C-terminal domain-containing protein [Sodalis endosymbiont of Henestaris halophilus]SNC58665.1 DNA polymerase III subunit delta' [Sodalis endosymbiont of Henestaris halophilus]